MTVGFKVKALIILYKYLYTKFGLFKTLELLNRLILAMMFRNPWKGQLQSKNAKEELTKKTLTPLILLYNILKRLQLKESAQDLMKNIIIKTSILFMKTKIPIIRRTQLCHMDTKDQDNFLKRIADDFFNTEMGRIKITDKEFSYDITTCYFVDLLKKINLSELAPFFCQADFIYFSEYQPEVFLNRTQTLAEDGKACDFKFTLRNS